MAIWDIMGKACGLPVHKLLGSSGRARVKAYASSISWGDDEVAAAQTERALAAGFDAIKIKVGPPIGKALARAAFIRRIAGDAIELTADANSGFDFDHSVRLGRGLADLGYEWLEEPLIPEDNEGYLRLRHAVPLRVALGESDHTVYDSRALITAGAVGVIQPDPARAGGLTETRRIGLLAYAFNVPFAPHVGFCGAVCAAAGLHLAAALPNFLTYEAMTFANLMRQELATVDVTDPRLLEDSTLPVPTGPGLGIEIDRDFVSRYRIDGR
jgi:galactonate dehydratase